MNSITAAEGWLGEHCELCPRRCRVRRQAGQLGFCGAGQRARIFSYGPHHGEEPPLSGTRGSGAVFFSGCTLRCLYCQNHPWSQANAGELFSVAELADLFRQLRVSGCHNWNLVSPTPWVPQIIAALAEAAEDGARLPVVYNTSGFERVETIRRLRGQVDIYLCDLRYAHPESALAGSGAPEYVGIAREALREMWHQVGPLHCDSQGLALGGVICRLLVLPGRADEVCENLAWLADTLGTEIALSVMSQYTPAHQALHSPPWNRRITLAEYERVCQQVTAQGFSRGWIQDYDTIKNIHLAGFHLPARTQTTMQKGHLFHEWT
ncbi:MAG: radical SAM protein [Lentisphaerae bacterium]|nr:radical SAM protein [Lentisphaerota bacterium]